MKKIVIAIVILLVVIQFFPVNLPEVNTDNPGDLLKNADVPEEVAEIFKTSCYDCHSNETVYPWYSHVAPISYLVKRDVEKGREELNFSEWTKLKKSKKLYKLDEIGDEVKEGDMPMPVYTIIHSHAKLTDKQKELIVNWADEYAEKVFNN